MEARDTLTFPQESRWNIDPYLPATVAPSSTTKKPIHVTLTFATSLDSSLSLSPGVQTVLSGPESKAMTHYLRSKHDAILVGVGTAIADNPSLNCRIEGVGGYGGENLTGQPRPVVLDPRGRWLLGDQTKILKLAKEGRGKAPFVVSSEPLGEENRKILESAGGKNIVLGDILDPTAPTTRLPWHTLLAALSKEGIQSLMIEGGGAVINDLLHPSHFSLVDTVIVTIAPIWLGKDGVQVCPEERVDEERNVKVPVAKLRETKWVPLGDDVVLCGRPIA
ncbi:uracil reductase [Lophiotrema nucula]|uniref:2,5-diamino-6-ribosylamino-4(3H)-pyrimidinone 5'-phosphate reductase n=1 Tax=Lophiotrema nucula TaxID=690887 RepID=A0A6A5ZDB6_9PLEO|nr:uracil reductase [Lophiotrema nucula]